MRTVNISQAKAHLSRLVEEAAGGEEVVITKHNRPVARLVALEASTRPRKPGGWEGRLWMADDFDAPLPKAVEDEFYGDDSGEPPAS
ncbi:MAG: type II toxin-antitoxin system Phd/YefM family antitoxin [Rhodospirillales bacterium]|nr:type II toxin-antitoxin system Phd/YefM family antitoxin [Rhodospirillales bacterium]MDE0380295.1 type II toxin-antitoxin system Phd/YefM family antitoxin [Rhodospirillales bacterium]